MSGVFSFAIPLISQPPAAIPLVEARLFIVTPFDEVRRNHELVIALTAGLVHDVIAIQPLQSQIQRFSVHIKHLSEQFLCGTDKTCLGVNIESEPEENAQSCGCRRIFQQLIAFIKVESHKGCLLLKSGFSGNIARRL